MPLQTDIYRSGSVAPIIRGRNGEAEYIERHWGLRPKESNEPPIINLRAEGRHFAPEQRCLIPANGIFVPPSEKPAKERFEAVLPTEPDFFCFAGIWRPATEDWPESFAALTIDAAPDLAAYTDRQMAVMPKPDWSAWLFGERPEEELLRPLPAGSYRLIPRSQAAAVRDLFG